MTDVAFERAGLLPAIALLLVGVTSAAFAVASIEHRAPTPIPAPSSPSPSPIPNPTPLATPIPTTITSAAPSLCAPRVAVLFANGEAMPPVQTASALQTFVAWLTAHPDTALLVNGHADSTGNDDTNIALSHRRARSVAKLLEDAGVAKTRMTVRGFGAFQPLEGTDEASPDNRRVNLRVRGVPACADAPEEVISP